MNKLDINSAYNALQAMSRDKSYGSLRDMSASNGWTFGAGLANGRNFRNQILREQEAARNKKKFEDNYKQLNMKHKSGSNGVDQVGGTLAGVNNGRVIAQGRQGVDFPSTVNDIIKNNRIGDSYNGSEAIQEVAQNYLANKNGNPNIQQNTMPTLQGGMYNGRITPQDGVYMQGRTDVAFPTMNGNVTQMGNLYGGNRAWYGRNDGTFDFAFRNAEQIINNPVMNPARTYEVDRYPKELVGLTGEDLQRAGLAYNQGIDRGYGGVVNTVVPQARQVQQAVAPRYATNNTQPTNDTPIADSVPIVKPNTHGGIPSIHGGGSGAFGPEQRYVDPAPNMPVEDNPYRQYGLNGEYDNGEGSLWSAIKSAIWANDNRYDDSF